MVLIFFFCVFGVAVVFEIGCLIDSSSVWPSKHEIVIWDAVGFNEHEPPGGPKYFANTFGANNTQQQGSQMIVKAVVVESDITSMQNKMKSNSIVKDIF